MTVKRVTAEINLCTCQRCGHQWTSKGIPKSCANNGSKDRPACRSTDWNRPRIYKSTVKEPKGDK